MFPKRKRSCFSTGTPPPYLRRWRRTHILLVCSLATRSISQVENINKNLSVCNFNIGKKPVFIRKSRKSVMRKNVTFHCNPTAKALLFMHKGRLNGAIQHFQAETAFLSGGHAAHFLCRRSAIRLLMVLVLTPDALAASLSDTPLSTSFKACFTCSAFALGLPPTLPLALAASSPPGSVLKSGRAQTGTRPKAW